VRSWNAAFVISLPGSDLPKMKFFWKIKFEKEKSNWAAGDFETPN
jgi:hypothetical protein